MLKVALYFMVLFLLVSAIVIFIFAVNKGNKKKLNIINSAYLVISLINYMMLLGELVDTGWNLIIITPVSVVTIILLITSLIISNSKKRVKDGKISMTVSIVTVIIPFLIIGIPFAYETYLLNFCTYLFEYNYQNGFVTSDDYYVAIVNSKPHEVSLTKNIFSREATYDTNNYMEFASYNVDLESTGEIKINDLNNNSEYVDEVYAIAESIKLTNLLAESLEVDYLPEVKGAIVRVFMKNGDGGDYYYQEGQFNAFDVGGSLRKITYYK